jgi:DNA-binding transcriptional LysR family regulator
MVVNLPTTLLRSFVAIVDSGSMRRASAQLLVSQPALSLQMKRLESIMQKPLFRRVGRQLVLTSEGQALLDDAREILSINDRVIAAARRPG